MDSNNDGDLLALTYLINMIYYYLHGKKSCANVSLAIVLDPQNFDFEEQKRRKLKLKGCALCALSGDANQRRLDP